MFTVRCIGASLLRAASADEISHSLDQSCAEGKVKVALSSSSSHLPFFLGARRAGLKWLGYEPTACKILDDPALLKKGETDIALCNANLDSGAVDEGARKCMGLKGYALVRKDEAEDARAGFAAAQRVSTPSARAGSK
jgi:hypothetical protein